MASKLRQGRDIEIPGVNAAQSLQEAINEIRSIRDSSKNYVRPEGSVTVKEFAIAEGISESTAKVVHLYPLVREGLLEVIRMHGPKGGIIHYYRKKTQEIESIRKEAQPASNGHALATDKGRRGKRS